MNQVTGVVNDKGEIYKEAEKVCRVALRDPYISIWSSCTSAGQRYEAEDADDKGFGRASKKNVRLRSKRPDKRINKKEMRGATIVKYLSTYILH